MKHNLLSIALLILVAVLAGGWWYATNPYDPDSYLPQSETVGIHDINTTKEYSLTNTRWVWQETILSTGEVIAPNMPGSFSVTYADDGSFFGQTDCNGFASDYQIVDDTIVVGPFAMTKMYCENSQESEFVAMIEAVATFIHDSNGSLLLLMQDGAGTVMFVPE